MRPSPSPAMAVRRSVAAACLLLLAGLALTGCSSDEPEPIIDRQAVTTPPTPTSSPSATPTREPWERRTKAGAVAFVEHWVEVLNRASRTGNTRALQQMSAPGCASCRGIIRVIDDLASEQGSIRSDGWSILQIGTVPGLSLDEMTIGMTVQRSPEVVTRGDGSSERFPGGRASYSVSPRWSNNQWLLAELTPVA